ncbi:MAG: hypothetical protein K2J02_00490 [Malacoplasma sp.]|nr:hypothetical protein [Malacoplasma sp.]MDE5952509.1 hypothetical protein [Malacoplasma sp.]MDE6893838.1 hypothetical protein [Malacoplasma sp.]MDE7075287.1 hypothetical protein [Malacoplasma sp.]
MKKNYFNNAMKKIAEWPTSKKIYVILWIITAILLIVTIILFVVWQQSSLQTYGDEADAQGLKYLTTEAVYQQDVIAGITLTTVIFLAISIFTTTLSCWKNKKKGGNKNARSA